MEVDRVKHEPNIRNPNQFRRNFNPHFQQIPPRNNDHQIQAPLKYENMLEGHDDQENENAEEAMNLDNYDEVNPHVSQEEYEQSLSFGQFLMKRISTMLIHLFLGIGYFFMQFKLSCIINMT
jgi:hypothetical protein